MDCEVPNISPGIGIASTVHIENLLLAPFTMYCIAPREDKGDREGIPHTHPIP